MVRIDSILRANPKNSKYGAPMGQNMGQPATGEKYHLQLVALDSGGYDASGAYWGSAGIRGLRLYCAFNKEGKWQPGLDWRAYVRATSREAAITSLEEAYGIGVENSFKRLIKPVKEK